MNLPCEVELPEIQPAATAYWCGKGGEMALKTHCAYNQTRECFLGLQVTSADLPYASVEKYMETVALKSGEGLWLSPFRGIPVTDLHAPLDLIYLDGDCRVSETVESFPTFRASASSPWPASVLALPAHSIYSSQTQSGDQLLLCKAEEMGQRLDGQAETTAAEGTLQGAVLLRESPLWSGGPGMLELEESGRGGRAPQQRHEMGLIKPGTKPVATPRNWLQRWWSPDPRKAPREPSSGLAAYYWNGAAPEAHGIRDISSSGLYVVTEERWYPGTLVLMTLQRTDVGEEVAERSIAVQSRAVRWGHDGVGLQFILSDAKDLKRGNSPMQEGADRKEFERFLQQLRNSK
jgi:hypothetical protein